MYVFKKKQLNLEMAWWIKVLAIKPDGYKLDPRNSQSKRTELTADSPLTYLYRLWTIPVSQ